MAGQQGGGRAEARSRLHPGDRLGLLAAAWLRLLREGDSAGLGDLLDDRVIWQGILPQQVCDGRDEVLTLIGRQLRRQLRLTRFDAEEAGDRVAVSVASPDFPAMPDQPADAPRSLVFTFAGTRVVRMDSYPSREAAWAALAVPEER